MKKYSLPIQQDSTLTTTLIYRMHSLVVKDLTIKPTALRSFCKRLL